MSTILSNIAQKTTEINDKVIAGSMLSSAKTAADAYLNATMTTATPELKSIYLSNLNQVVGGHSALTELAVNKGWEKPYETPTEQLCEVVGESETRIN